MKVQSYLSFEGRCDEALAFYKKALGAEVTQVLHYSDMPAGAMDQPHPDVNVDATCAGAGPLQADKVMHASFRIGETELLATDGQCSGKPEFKGISLSISAKTDAEARKWFDALADGGTVVQPLIPTFFTSAFGMVNDPFGVSWMLVADPA